MPYWDALNEKLKPNQRALDFTDVVPTEEDPFKLNFFALTNDPACPMYKPADPSFSPKDDRLAELENFRFDPPYLNFTEK